MAADFGQFSIPKTARVPSATAMSWAEGERWFLRISLAIGIASVLTAGGLFVYRRSLETQRERWVRDVRAESKALDAPSTTELIHLSRSIAGARELLASHLFTTNIFDFLRQTTHPQVQFTSLNFAHDRSLLELSGLAVSYRTVAEQVSILESRPEVSAVDFGGLAAGARGLISFRLSIAITPALLRYRGGASVPPAPPLP